MRIYKYSMRIYKYSMGFRVPVMDQSDRSICYNYDLKPLLTLINCDGKISGLRVTNWMVCLCKLCISDIQLYDSVWLHPVQKHHGTNSAHIPIMYKYKKQ